MNRLEFLQTKNYLYKKQIKELQNALKIKQSAFELLSFEAAFYREMWQRNMLEKNATQKTKDEIIEIMRSRWTNYKYKIVEIK